MRSLVEIYNSIIKYSNNEIAGPVSKERVALFERKANIKLPDDFKDLLYMFNGGEIFIPGTVIYGLVDSNNDLFRVNSMVKEVLDIPQDYIVIAKLNYGDYICLNTNNPFNVIQWDHECNEKFCEWDSLIDWLDESVDFFIEEMCD